MKTNYYTPQVTYEGGPSTNISAIERLTRTVLACMLWEDTFYEDGIKVADRIAELCNQVTADQICHLIYLANEKYHLRHVPLWLTIHGLSRRFKNVIWSDIIKKLCNRPDQMTELLSLYWKYGKKPLPAQMKKGLAKAFRQFDEYQLQKYNRYAPIKLRDVLFLCHAKPKDEVQADLWKRLIANELKTPDTWETRLSAGDDKKVSFQDLLETKKLGKLAILRNLRNMQEAGVKKETVRDALLDNPREMLPFQFIAAAKACPLWKDILDVPMVQAAKSKRQFTGKTVIFVDVSGSMASPISSKSQTSRMDAACGFAILLRERCADPLFASFSDQLMFVPSRNGFALRDAITKSQNPSGTYLGQALTTFFNNHIADDAVRMIVITDEQTHDAIPRIPVKNCYVLNVGTNQNGIQNNGQWLTISGFAEASIDYIQEIETINEKKD